MQVRIALPSALLNNALLGEEAGVPQAYDFFNGADPDEVVLAALEKTRAALAEEYGSDDVADLARCRSTSTSSRRRTTWAFRRPARTRGSRSEP